MSMNIINEIKKILLPLFEVEQQSDIKVGPDVVSKVTFKDYMGTNESEELPFPMKYAMLGRDSNTFIQDMSYLYLKFKGEGKSADEIVGILAPHLKGKSSDFQAFIKSLDQYYEREKPAEYDKIIYKAAADVREYGADARERFFDFKMGDEKAGISYHFNATPNQLKLSPTGFWQLQFAARIAAGKQKHPEEEVFLISKYKDTYRGRALAILDSFYRKAIIPIAIMLSGRAVNKSEFHPDDTQLQIKIDAAVDKLKDKISMYDVNRDNIGAWALTVMKNEIIDIIKSITTMELRGGYDLKSGINVRDAFEGNNWNIWYSTLPDANVTPGSLLSNPESISAGGTAFYKYVFKTAFDAYLHFEDAISGEDKNVFKHLDKNGEQKLKDIGALRGVRRYAGYYPPDYEEPSSFEINKPAEQKEAIFEELAKFAKQSAGLPFKLDVSKKTKGYEAQKELANKLGMNDAGFDETFSKDIGRAIYELWTNYVIFSPVWTSKPSDELLRSIDTKQPFFKEYTYISNCWSKAYNSW